MVYCGKASQGCQSCRVRRIKCDKLRPDCSQCIRVGKKCPGYRDQLSLMFRDESSKVIQKAHAQWGTGEGPDDPSQQNSGFSDSPTSSSGTHISHFAHSPFTPTSPTDPSTLVNFTPPSTIPSLAVPLEEQGMQFFFDQYVLGHPDEPRTIEELRSNSWFCDPGMQSIMTAVGLASLANLGSRPDLMIAARQHYGTALRHAGEVVQARSAPSMEVSVRSIVTLAIFELVNGPVDSIKSAHAHIIGGVALMRAWYPMPNVESGGMRGMVQLCYSMFMASYLGNMKLIPAMADWIAFMRSEQDPIDYPSTDLGVLVSRFTDLAVFVHTHFLSDGRPTTTSTMQELAELEVEFEAWEQRLEGEWLYTTEDGSHLPSEAIFEGEYHIYSEMWFARMWGHYRWARLLLNQELLELFDNNPISAQALALPLDRARIAGTIKRLARDTLVSVANHWRHPNLPRNIDLTKLRQRGVGSGPAGIGILIYHLRTAACAPGVPLEYGDWAHGITGCIWRGMGMRRAKATMDDIEAHQNRRRRMASVKLEAL